MGNYLILHPDLEKPFQFQIVNFADKIRTRQNKMTK